MRNRFAGTAERPRLSVFRSNNHMYAQIIDDDAQKTLVAASTAEKAVKAELDKTNDVAAASYVGTVIAKRALEAGITEVVFDRGGYVYTGRVAALAAGAGADGVGVGEYADPRSAGDASRGGCDACGGRRAEPTRQSCRHHGGL